MPLHHYTRLCSKEEIIHKGQCSFSLWLYGLSKKFHWTKKISCILCYKQSTIPPSLPRSLLRPSIAFLLSQEKNERIWVEGLESAPLKSLGATSGPTQAALFCMDLENNSYFTTRFTSQVYASELQTMKDTILRASTSPPDTQLFVFYSFCWILCCLLQTGRQGGCFPGQQ